MKAMAIDTPVDLEIWKLMCHLWCNSNTPRECSRLGRNKVK